MYIMCAAKCPNKVNEQKKKETQKTRRIEPKSSIWSMNRSFSLHTLPNMLIKYFDAMTYFGEQRRWNPNKISVLLSVFALLSVDARKRKRFAKEMEKKMFNLPGAYAKANDQGKILLLKNHRSSVSTQKLALFFFMISNENVTFRLGIHFLYESNVLQARTMLAQSAYTPFIIEINWVNHMANRLFASVWAHFHSNLTDDEHGKTFWYFSFAISFGSIFTSRVSLYIQ